ncbi:hypothetical protein CKY51_20360 [Xanthomonas maliensis]|nr:hypothetical protein CKY51_20360 [Xanthomonas maliensis]
MFEEWAAVAVGATRQELREEMLLDWQAAPYAQAAQPHADHLMPRLVIAGAAGSDVGRRSFQDVLGGLTLACYQFG